MEDRTALKLYNTLTREKVEFQPIDPTNVRMYVCGPTVYDFAHIGNARPVIVFDVLYRLLRHIYGETHVTYARNITDVDDKINARALRDFGSQIADGSMSLNAAIRAVTEKTESQFHADVAALGCLKPTVEPRATDNIVQMVEIIQRLLDQGHAYVATGSEGSEILFATASMVDYGQLSKRRLEDQQAGARVAVEAHKASPGDFVLWKQSADTEPGWPGNFTYEGETFAIHGRPGWHIECSAMSNRYLWEEIKHSLSPKGKAHPHEFDIHGGGLDLIFPHHENEIAQSCCAYKTDVMANVWMHNGFLQVEGRKMSKSEGNFVTIQELLHTEKFGGRKWPGEVLRLAMLMTHYRQPIDFSLKRLEEAFEKLIYWTKLAERCGAPHTWSTDNLSNFNVVEVSPALLNVLTADINSYEAIQAIDRIAKDTSTGQSEAARGAQLVLNCRFIGLDLAKFDQSIDEALMVKISPMMRVGVDDLILKRLELLAAKNFAEADKIRDDLLAQGIQLKDGKDAVTGERVTTWEFKL